MFLAMHLKLFFFFKGMDRRIFLIIGIPSIIFVIIGAYLSPFLRGEIPALVLGVFLVAFSLFLILKPNFTFLPSNKNGFIGGSLSGLAAGLLGTGGAIRGLTLAAFHVEKATFLATSALIDFGVDSSRFVVYFSQDYITKDMLWKAPKLLVISFFGTWVGRKLLNKISQDNFRKIALWLILIVGITSVIKFLFALISI